MLLLHSPCVPQQQGQPRSRGISKRNVCLEGLHCQQDLTKKKTCLDFNTQGEPTESAVERKISLQVCGVISFSKSVKVNKNGTLGCCFPKNFTSGERGSDSQALKEGPGTEKSFRANRHQELSSLLLTCSSPGTHILTASTSQPWYCCEVLAAIMLTLRWLCCRTRNSWALCSTVTLSPLH